MRKQNFIAADAIFHALEAKNGDLNSNPPTPAGIGRGVSSTL
jgi:hypothetical protein